MKSKFLLCLSVLQVAAIMAMGQASPDDILGVWLTAGREPAKIHIYKSGVKYFGKIAWLKYPEENGRPRADNNNPDKARRSRPIVGLVILKDFVFGGNEWNNGKIYDPESGKTYHCYLSLKDKNTLKVRGYVGVSFLGRTETWTRNSL